MSTTPMCMYVSNRTQTTAMDKIQPVSRQTSSPGRCCEHRIQILLVPTRLVASHGRHATLTRSVVARTDTGCRSERLQSAGSCPVRAVGLCTQSHRKSRFGRQQSANLNAELDMYLQTGSSVCLVFELVSYFWMYFNYSQCKKPR